VTVSNRIPFGARTAWFVNPQLPPLLLYELTSQVKELTYHRSRIGIDGQETEHSMRTSNQSWLCWDTWVAGIMHNIFISANNDFFKYDLDHFDSGIQATKYEVGQKYGWHVDDGDSIKKPRKLSMSLVLGSEFTGGELEIFDSFQNKNLTYDIKPGNVVIFPSWMSHRVKPVTSGTRYSLVAWMNGPEFK